MAQGTVWSFSPETISSGPRLRSSSVDLRLRPRIEVGGRGLEERRAGGQHGEGVVELPGLRFADGVGEAETELLESDAAPPGCSWPGCGGPATRTSAPRSAAAARRGTEPGGSRRHTVALASPRPARICTSRPPKEWPTMAGFLVKVADEISLEVVRPGRRIALPSITSGCALASATRSGSSGQPGVSAE